MKNVLVLGANGFIGQHLVSQLLGKVNVIGYGKTVPPICKCSEFIQGDFTTDTRFENLLRKYHIEVVYHLISTTIPVEGTRNAFQELEENVIPTVRFLEAMKNAGTAQIIFASSGGTVYGESNGYAHRCTDALHPICSYGIQKTTIEQYMQLYEVSFGMDCVIARISNPYGVFPQHDRTQGIIPIFLQRLLRRQPITLYGETIRDYIFISDAVDALLKLMAYRGDQRIFNIGSGIPTGLHHLAEMLEEATQRKFVEIREFPIRSCDVRESVLDITETKKELDWEPKVSLSDGIRKTLKQISLLEQSDQERLIYSGSKECR
ncbi:NAD-dependent epimerase/dehydratase family protein [Caproicibacter fermentans]|uniref:NAD-dependent epimerase/dehydratase family protein n=1 Tax=Caproicibacter fermentans TaxID=2576756 RepID=A0A7G8TFN1_9FIRM|nr:NAD-dependent epimerase/dehydratase family protein [Caproicibacter fermentans]QNK42422.1 NAD-dependent epimerase/dehydratase family protein [Caproicibacter fermentans]